MGEGKLQDNFLVNGEVVYAWSEIAEITRHVQKNGWDVCVRLKGRPDHEFEFLTEEAAGSLPFWEDWPETQYTRELHLQILP